MRRNDQLNQGVTWGVGCLVAAAAMLGIVILLMYVAFIVDLPVWAQILLGLVLTLGGALLTWLVVSALAPSRRKDPGPPPTIASVPGPPDPGLPDPSSLPAPGPAAGPVSRELE